MLTLPLLRSFQYSYPKFFVMFPALVALGAAYFPTRAIGIAALTLAAFNLPYQANLVAESRALRPVYAGAGTDGAGCQPRGAHRFRCGAASYA